MSKANTEEHNRYIKMIRSIISIPLKLSGNITSVRSIIGTDVNRYAVNLTQAKAIIREFQQQPDGLTNLLNNDNTDENTI